jgi:hypothetical protein
VLVNGQAVASRDAMATQITATVPAAFPVVTCDDAVEVRVENDVATSCPATLHVVSPAPELAQAGGPGVTAGASLALAGSHLGGATLTLDGQPLALQSATDTLLTSAISRDTPQGAHALVVQGTCGSVTATLAVLPPGLACSRSICRPSRPRACSC